MKFKFVKQVEGEVGVYGNKFVKTGDTVEYEGFRAEKAKNNPDFEQVKTRKAKNGDSSGNTE